VTPERWAQIEDLFHRAVECGPERRTALLDQSCSDDPELRREVEALLSCDGSARDNVQAAIRPAIEGFGFPLTGEVISHYRILDGLGRGGMGLVYRAEDIRLGRLVALKFLPEESANNPVALARFEREARAVSAVEHPNICPIYEFGEHEGRPFLVMQLLEGQTLRELLEVRRSEEPKPSVGAAAERNMGLPLDQLLDLGIQIADGLHAAHQKGIIHRDIKPANIFVTNEGQVRILDFGLAKLAQDVAVFDDDMAANGEEAGGRARNVDPVLSRTGAAIGTVAYMSPEQASGETLDRRTDIYSLGLVLYEMATGALPRSGVNTPCSDVRLVTSEPLTANTILTTRGTSYHAIKAALVRGRKRQPQMHVPRRLEIVISRATNRDRERRYQNISELASDLRTTKLERVSRTRRTRIVLILLALTLLLAAAAPKIFRFAQQSYRLRQLQNLSLVPLTTTLSGNAVAPAFSPDGRKIVFAWDGENGDQAYDLYVKPIGTEELHRMTEQPGRYHSAWSPDGRSIAFVRLSDPDHSGLFIIPSSGGPESKITPRCYSTVTGIGAIAWSPNGKHIACIGIGPTSTTAQLFLVATETFSVTPVETGCSRPISPSFSPDSEYLSWTCSPIIGGASDVQFMRLATRRVSRLLQRADTIGGPVWDPDGQRLLFSSDIIGDLWEVSFRDPDRLEKVLAGHDAFDLAFSPTGDRLAFAQNHTNVNIWAVDVTGAQPNAFLRVSSSREQNTPAVSPDGSKIAFESNRSGANEIWVSDEYGRNSVQLSSFGIEMTGTPRWSPDGSLIAFASRAGGESNIYLVDPRGGTPRKLGIDVRGNSQPSWSRDGNWIYFVNGEDAQHSTCWKVSASGGHAVRLTDGPALRPLESPDGRNLYFARQSGQLVRADTDGHELEEILEIGPVEPGGWVPVDDGIYFIHLDNNRRNIAFFDFATRGIRPIYRLRKPSPRWFGGMSVYRNWLLFPQLDNQTSDLVMIENWNKEATTQKNEVRIDTSTPLQSPQSPSGYVPTGWVLAGSDPAGYKAGVDSQIAINGHQSVYLKSKFAPGLGEKSVTPSPDGFGTLMQSFSAKNYTGKRLRLSAFVKSENVMNWAGLWMRINKGSEIVAFDNMQDRPIKRTTGWQNYHVVLDVASDATDIYFGILLNGPGSVWLNTVNLEVVGSEVTTTDQKYH
jgi:serine/threonine protein kinase